MSKPGVEPPIHHKNAAQQSEQKVPERQSGFPVIKIIFQTADFNDKNRRGILIKEVQDCFGDHNVISKHSCKNHPEFMIGEIEILSSQPVRA